MSSVVSDTRLHTVTHSLLLKLYKNINIVRKEMTPCDEELIHQGLTIKSSLLTVA